MADGSSPRTGDAGHATHDLEALAAFADDESDAPEAVRAQVAGCLECAALVADLRLLTGATAALAVPARTRDFRLSPEDAVRLAPADAARLAPLALEPVGAPGRLGLDMTTPARDHTTHDPLLIAAHLDSTLDARDTERVEGWLAGCGACATLRTDLEALAAATRLLPTPPRPRDFRLTDADAARARGHGWRRVLAAFASPGASFTRPLAVGLTTMGLAGLIIANIPSAALFGSSAGAAPTVSQAERSNDLAVPAALAPAAGAAASAAASAGALDPGALGSVGAAAIGDGASASPGMDITGEYAPEASAADRNAVGNGAAPPGPDSAKASSSNEALTGVGGGPSLLVLASAALLLTGLALVLLRWGARRLGNG